MEFVTPGAGRRRAASRETWHRLGRYPLTIRVSNGDGSNIGLPWFNIVHFCSPFAFDTTSQTTGRHSGCYACASSDWVWLV